MSVSPVVLDVLCVGPCVLSRAAPPEARHPFSMRGALEVAALLSKAGLSVGLASPTDGQVIHGVLVGQAADLGILVGPWRGVRQQSARSPRGGRVEREIFSISERWRSNVLVISGVDTNLASAGNLCRLARAFRRDGAIVIVDLRSDLAWGHERSPLVLRSLLLESDIVRVRREDTGVLQLTLADFFGMVRPEAVVLASGASRLEPRLDVHVGETRSIPLRDRDVHAVSGGDGLVAAVAAVCARQGSLSPQEDSTWESVVERLELLAAR